MFPFHVYATMWLINQKCFGNKPFYFQTPKNLMTNSLLLSSQNTEISLTLALVALFTLIFCLVAFLQSALCACSCFLTPDSTINLYFMSVRQLLNYFLARSNGGMRERYGKSEQTLEKKNNFIFLRLYSLFLPSVASYCMRSERMAVISFFSSFCSQIHDPNCGFVLNLGQMLLKV